MATYSWIVWHRAPVCWQEKQDVIDAGAFEIEGGRWIPRIQSLHQLVGLLFGHYTGKNAGSFVAE